MNTKKCCLAFFFACLLLAQPLAHAEWIDPTRNPSAPAYDAEHPEELLPEHIVARSAVLLDRTTGEILYAINPDEPIAPGSLVSLLTALVALENGNPEDIIMVSKQAVDLPEDASRVPLHEDEALTLRDALYGLLLRGSCDAANAIAEHIAGDAGAFVSLMNEKAKALGLSLTLCANPHGYPGGQQQTTARDMAFLTCAAMEQPLLREIMKTAAYTMPATNLSPAREMRSAFLPLYDSDRLYTPSLGGKGSFTKEAGYGVVHAAEKDGRELIAAILYSGHYSYWSDTTRLLEYGFTLPR